MSAREDTLIASPFTSSALRRTATHLGVAGAAVVATMFTLAPPVAADEDPNGIDTTTEPKSDPSPSEPASDPTPTEPASDPTPTEPASDPGPTDPASDPPPAESTDASQPTDTATPETGAAEPGPTEPTTTEGLTASATTATDPEAAARQASLAAVEPDFGYTKFRVGVQIEDGSFVPAGTTTLGSEITIVESGPSVPGTKSTTCTTTAFLDPGNPTASYCENLNPGGGPFADYYLAMLDSILTITQTSVNANLVITDGTKTVVPECDVFPVCLFNAGDVLLTDAVARDRDDDSDDDDGDDSDKADGSDRAAALPDTGGEDPRLLAYGVGLMAGGGSLLALGRRRRAYEPQH